MVSDRIAKARKDSGLTQRALAGDLELSPSAVAQWETRDTPFEAWRTLARLARRVGKSADWLLALSEQENTGRQGEPRPKEWEPYRWIPVEAEVGAGPGTDWRDLGPAYEPEDDERVRDWRDVVPIHQGELWQWGGVTNVRAARVASGRFGSSMLPVIQPGAILIVQAGPFEKLVSGDIYVCLADEYAEGVVAKRVFAAGEQLVLWSENAAYEPRARYITLGEEDEGINRIVRGKVVKIIENV
jgi:transcriptional regulator with XRE-family HTH domain